MKQSELSSVDLLTKYVNLQEELSSLVSYIDDTRQTLGGVQEKLPSASDALSGVVKATEKATHNILELVEQVIERDGEIAEAFARIESSSSKEETDDALRAVKDAADERMVKLTNVMTELSFQDLTCQAIQKISETILEIEKRVLCLIEPIETGRERAAATAEKYSGLDRLEESSSGENRQELIDQLLNRR